MGDCCLSAAYTPIGSVLNPYLILSQKVCAGRSRTNVPTPGYNIQPLFRILPQHTVALRCAKSLELPSKRGFYEGIILGPYLGSWRLPRNRLKKYVHVRMQEHLS